MVGDTFLTVKRVEVDNKGIYVTDDIFKYDNNYPPWICQNCGYVNDYWREACNRCGEFR